jgi:hypothetical protein
VNTEEVRAVVETLRDLMLSTGYAGTVGVVTPFRTQANAITEAAMPRTGSAGSHLQSPAFARPSTPCAVLARWRALFCGRAGRRRLRGTTIIRGLAARGAIGEASKCPSPGRR